MMLVVALFDAPETTVVVDGEAILWTVGVAMLAKSPPSAVLVSVIAVCKEDVSDTSAVACASALAAYVALAVATNVTVVARRAVTADESTPQPS